MSSALFTFIPELDAKIRCTNDGRSSVYDLISAVGQQKNPHSTWKRLTAGHPEVLAKCENLKFPGPGQRETPVTDLRGWLYILALLPGAMGKKYREEAAQLVTRYMKGDQSLIDEIRDRQPIDAPTPPPPPSSPSSLSSIFIPELDIHIRRTEDGHYSIYDLIEAVRTKEPQQKQQKQQKLPYRIWEPLVLRHQDILRKCHYVKFQGQSQHIAPVINLGDLPYLFKLLSESMGKTYREDSAKLTLQYLRGEKVEMKDSSVLETIPATMKVENLSPFPSSSSPIQQGREFAKYVLELLDGVTLGQTPEQDKNLKVGLAISATQAQIPELSQGLEPVKLALVSAAADEDKEENKENDVYLTPTALGKRLGISPRTMNNRLKRHGLQKRNRDFSKGQSAWLPTEKGKEYSILTVEEHRGEDPTRYQHLKWNERVLELFDSSLAA